MAATKRHTTVAKATAARANGKLGGRPRKSRALAEVVRRAKDTDAFFAERRGRADFDAFDQIMARQGGEPPRPDDLIP